VAAAIIRVMGRRTSRRRDEGERRSPSARLTSRKSRSGTRASRPSGAGRARPSGTGRARTSAGGGGGRPSRSQSQSRSRSRSLPAVEWLPRGKPAPPDETALAVRQTVAGLREACSACPYRRICVFAPVKLQIESGRDPDARHRHQRTLKKGLGQLSRLDGDWQGALIQMLVGREKDALLAGCLLAVAWRRHPDPLERLLAYTEVRCDVDRLKEELAGVGSAEERALEEGQGVDPERLQQQMFRGQVIRLAAFMPRDDALRRMQDLLVLDADEEDRLFQYEAVGVLALLIGLRLSGSAWVKSLERDAPGPFRSTFASRDPGNGAIDVFFPYRRGNKRSYLYLRRDRDGEERITSIDKVRVDSLLYRMFLVFNTDALKTHRIFKELCRHINVRAGKYNVHHVLAAFERLGRDDLLLLGIYAPALARAVGHYLDLDRFHLLVKHLYQLRTESGRRGEEQVAAHEKVVESRDEWEELVDALGADLIKDVFSVLFRLNASYKKRPYTTPTYLKIGEVAYLLTAMSGWNPKGLEIELKQAKKPLAFVAYGLQPPGKWSKIRVGKITRARERALRRGREELERAAEQGMAYMAFLHGYESFPELERAVADEDWEPPERTELPSDIEASADDFSEFADDSYDDDSLDGVDPNHDDVFVVVEDDQTDERGQLITQRMPKQRSASDTGEIVYDETLEESDDDDF